MGREAENDDDALADDGIGGDHTGR